MSKKVIQKGRLDKLRKSQKIIEGGEIHEIPLDELYGKFDDSYFELTIKPKDIEFLKSLQTLQEDKEFQKKLLEVKKKCGII